MEYDILPPSAPLLSGLAYDLNSIPPERQESGNQQQAASTLSYISKLLAPRYMTRRNVNILLTIYVIVEEEHITCSASLVRGRDNGDCIGSS